MDQQLKDAMNQFKNATAMVSLGQTIDKGTSYGASAETLARATADRGFPNEPIAGDHRAVEDLYQVTHQIRQVPIKDSDAKVIIRKVKSSGQNIQQFIDRMERDRQNLSDKEEAQFGSTYENNIKTLRNALNKGGSN